jgi:NitT/TauT family transport system ATP-binding protein
VTPAVISTVGLEKRYATRRGEAIPALGPLDLTVGAGEFVAVVGPSGCGKSTLLRLVAGLTAPSGGEVLVGGAAVRGPRADVGLVFQRPTLLPWRTARANVLLPAEVLGLERRAARRRAEELLALVGLAEAAERYPAELSGGMQARVALARALAHDPPMLLMDEPFGALDALTREAMGRELLRVWDGAGPRKTVLFVTHGIAEAVFLADRVVALTARPGRVADVVPVDLPRPRGAVVLESEAFALLAARVRAALGG